MDAYKAQEIATAHIQSLDGPENNFLTKDVLDLIEERAMRGRLFFNHTRYFHQSEVVPNLEQIEGTKRYLTFLGYVSEFTLICDQNGLVKAIRSEVNWEKPYNKC